MRVPQQIFDPISENLDKLAELFPAAVKDGALDMEALRAELGDFEEIKPDWVSTWNERQEKMRRLRSVRSADEKRGSFG